jgi:hypothetical protein
MPHPHKQGTHFQGGALTLRGEERGTSCCEQHTNTHRTAVRRRRSAASLRAHGRWRHLPPAHAQDGIDTPAWAVQWSAAQQQQRPELVTQ